MKTLIATIISEKLRLILVSQNVAGHRHIHYEGRMALVFGEGMEPAREPQLQQLQNVNCHGYVVTGLGHG